MSSAQPGRPPNRGAFEVAIICALQSESDAVEASFDQEWEYGDDGFDYGKATGDPNAYTTGRIGQHNVVLAYVPDIGTIRAGTVAVWLRVSFPNIRLGLVVGICGVVPRPFAQEQEIFLGDVIVSTQVIEPHFGHIIDDEIEPDDTLQGGLFRAPAEICAFLQHLRDGLTRQKLKTSFSENLDILCNEKVFQNRKTPRPPPETDRLFNPGYRHKHQSPTNCQICTACVSPKLPVCQDALRSSCQTVGCKEDELIPWSTRARSHDDPARPLVGADHPVIHFGPIASSDQVVKSATHRDAIAERTKVLAFEMEGAGVWDTLPTIVVKAGCDYADSHKNKDWQNYAALAAASCTKAILSLWRRSD